MKSESISEVSLRDKNEWLAAEDIIGHEPVVEIEDVRAHHNVPLTNGRNERRIVALHLKGKQKKLVLNKTNIYTLKFLMGWGEEAAVNAKTWVGKRIKLRAEKLERPAFGRTHGIRIVPMKGASDGPG